jgi:2-polyprenyl-3-methyl-5-hydroxy-6-metoxy-1,4-benzoquinol methylase
MVPCMERQQWDERYAGADLLWHADPNRFLVEEVGGLAPGTVLDVACGEGRNAIWLAEKGWRATGVDFSTVAIAKARRMAEERGVEVEWIEADLRQWAPAGAFDLVVAMYLHLPAEPRRKVFSDAARAVAPQGTILVVGHDRENLTAGTGGPQDESVLFTAGEVTEILETVGGFTVRRAEQVRRPVATDDGPVNALDALVRAVRTG